MAIKTKYIVPIGVSIMVSENCSFKLNSIGVSEVKYNLETFDVQIFRDVCPDLDYHLIIKELIAAVNLFGKGHVFTNIIIGLGETDSTILDGIEFMAKNGIITNLRPIVQTNFRFKELSMIRPSKERLLNLYDNHKRILMKYGLSNLKALSMCSLCCGCDLVPQRDDL